MDFEELKRLPLGDAAKAIVTEGGATAGGFVGAGVLGRRIQSMVKSDAEVVTLTDKLFAWAGNNGPKIGLWYFLRGRPMLGGASEDFNKGIVTSVAFDTLMRLLHEGKNPSTATVMGYEALGEGPGIVGAGSADIQKLVQENSALRTELNKLRNAGIQVQQVPYAASPMDPRLPPYVGGGVAGAAIPPAERERRFAFMPGMGTPGVTQPPGTAHRQTKYGFAGETAVMSSGGRPGAAYVQAGKMFGMQ